MRERYRVNDDQREDTEILRRKRGDSGHASENASLKVVAKQEGEHRHLPLAVSPLSALSMSA